MYVFWPCPFTLSFCSRIKAQSQGSAGGWILFRPSNSGESHIKVDGQMECCGLQKGFAVSENPPKRHVDLTGEPLF